MSGDAVKIYFCDICAESIPLKDLELGAAIAIKGKVICVRCNPQSAVRAAAPAPTAFTPAPVAAAMGGGGSGVTGWVAGIALVASVGALALFFMQREEGQSAKQNLQASIQNSGHERDLKIEKLIAEQKALVDRVQDLSKGLRSEILAELDKERMSAENRGALLKERIEALQESLRATDTLRTRVEQIDAWKGATVQTLASIKSDLEGYLQELRSVKEAAMKASAAAVQPAIAIGPGAQPATAVPVPGWEDILKRLKDPDPGVRWTAILDLVQTGDPRAVPHLLPLLKDTDHFVRKNAADSLGELDAKAAVGELIEALNDSEHYVRESVYTSLKKITKQNIKFDPYAKTKEERDRGIAAWRDWWAANKGKVLGG